MTFNWKGLRDWGLPDLGKPAGKPNWIIADPPMECPNCGAILCNIEVELDGPYPGGRAIGKYLGCPACPYASPCLAIAKTKHEKDGTKK